MVNGEHLPSKDSSSLSQAKRTIHGCKENCLKNIKISELDASTRISYNLVFVCDVCFTIFQDQEMALFHINDFNHISASEFLMDKPMLNNNGSLKYVVNRCSIKSSSKNHSYGVFCPRDDCHFYFNNSIFKHKRLYRTATIVDADLLIFTIYVYAKVGGSAHRDAIVKRSFDLYGATFLIRSRSVHSSQFASLDWMIPQLCSWH